MDRLPLLPPGDELRLMVVGSLNFVAAAALLLVPVDPPWWAWVLAGILILNSIDRMGAKGTFAAAMFLGFVVAPLVLFPVALLSLIFGWY